MSRVSKRAFSDEVVERLRLLREVDIGRTYGYLSEVKTPVNPGCLSDDAVEWIRRYRERLDIGGADAFPSALNRPVSQGYRCVVDTPTRCGDPRTCYPCKWP